MGIIRVVESIHLLTTDEGDFLRGIWLIVHIGPELAPGAPRVSADALE
jgi:hypothetical protein